MNLKKFFNSILYPHIGVVVIILPISIALLVYSLVYFSSASVISIISYCLATYMLVVICMRVPNVVNFCKHIKNNNKYLRKYFDNVHLRINISLYGSLIWNIAFGIFQLGLGFYHNSLWFYSMSVYYVILATMRFFLFKHTRAYKPNEQESLELKRYRLCGILLCVLNIALTVIIFFMVYLNHTMCHHPITTITIATYTFTTFTFAIINNIRFRKYNSPIYSSAKNISLITACVSMITLENTMLTSFGNNQNPQFRQIMLACTGTVVLVFTTTLAVFMIVKANIKLKKLNQNPK